MTHYDTKRSTASYLNAQLGSGSATLPPLALGDTYTVAALAAELRMHAVEVNDRHLMEMADRLDGGTGAAVHHGCPDPSVPTAACTECWIVLGAELHDFPSVFLVQEYAD